MEELSLSDFAAQSAAFDASVLATEGIDLFCSSSDWILPASAAIMPPRTPWLLRGEHGWAALMRLVHPMGLALMQPLEAAWELACPLIGRDVGGLAEEFAAEARVKEPMWDALVLSGLQPDGAMRRSLLRTLGRRYEVRLGTPAVRCQVDLAEGTERFLARRSANFRRALRRAIEEGDRIGLGFERVDVTPANVAPVWQRLLAIEAESWKALADSGLAIPEMRRFYEQMLPRLAERGAARLLFARHEERDVGYILGGLLGSTYRGLQFSYHHEYQRFSLGNLAQWAQLRLLEQEGIATYDLGSDMEYKRRWADRLVETESLLFLKR